MLIINTNMDQNCHFIRKLWQVFLTLQLMRKKVEFNEYDIKFYEGNEILSSLYIHCIEMLEKVSKQKFFQP